MAHDGYYSSSHPYQTGNVNANPDQNDPYGPSPAPPYPSNYYEPDRLNMPQPQMPPNPSQAPNMEPYPEPPHQQNTGYLNDAVTSAVNNADSSAYLSPDVLSQITATVIQQLKATGLDNLPGSGSTAPPPRSQSQQPPYTAPEYPPRPHSESPPTASQRSGSAPNPVPNSYENPQSYTAPSGYADDNRPNTKLPPDASRRRHDSMSSQESQKAERPKPPSRDATVVEMTTLERIWGKLFEDGKPTKRLGQFLRGIAMHLVGGRHPLECFFALANLDADRGLPAREHNRHCPRQVTEVLCRHQCTRGPVSMEW